VSEEGMKIVGTLETIREDVALGTQVTISLFSLFVLFSAGL